MGAQIAGHFANAGIPALLFDINQELAQKGVDGLTKLKPKPLYKPKNADLVTACTYDNDLEKLSDVDLVIEAVAERLDIKHTVYNNIVPYLKESVILTSNTSGIPLEDLTTVLPDHLKKRFLITHFFNPPRYMRLLELVAGVDTRPEAIAALRTFGDRLLGKSVVDCKDTPGFIANRIGILWLGAAVRFAFEIGLTVEEADAVIGKPMGIPKTGVFGLLDLVGIDLQPHVEQSMLATLPEGDLYREVHRPSAYIERMIEEGYIGRKGKGGFYRLNRSKGGKVKEARDLETGEYRPAVAPSLASVKAGRQGMRALVEHPDRGGRYAWRVLSHTLSYAAALVPQIADDVHAVDQAMKMATPGRGAHSR